MGRKALIKDEKGLTVYHGSIFRVDKPELRPYESQKDFGQGFYLTTDKQQALNFAKNKMEAYCKTVGYINQYFIESFEGLNVLEFECANRQWIRFILQNQNLKTNYNYDVVIGKIADDNAKKVIRKYRRHEYDREAMLTGRTPEDILIDNLHTDRLKNQLCMHTQIAISRLKFVKASVVRG